MMECMNGWNKPTVVDQQRRARVPHVYPAVLLVLWMFWSPLSHAQTDQTVNLELALLVDVSDSVDSQEFALQARGLGYALRHPAVVDAALSGVSSGGIAITILQWSDAARQAIVADWTRIKQESDMLLLAQKAETMTRLIEGGHTSLSEAILFAMLSMEANALEGRRQVIDIVSDGRNNAGPPMRQARREVLESGIVINGIAILNELPLLSRYFRDHVIGGKDAFYIEAADYIDFQEMMVKKLIREIGTSPLSFSLPRDGRILTADGNRLSVQ